MNNPVNFEVLYVEKLKEIQNNNYMESSFELDRRTFEGVNVLLELLSFLGYDQVVDEFLRLDKVHADVRKLLGSKKEGNSNSH